MIAVLLSFGLVAAACGSGSDVGLATTQETAPEPTAEQESIAEETPAEPTATPASTVTPEPAVATQPATPLDREATIAQFMSEDETLREDTAACLADAIYGLTGGYDREALADADEDQVISTVFDCEVMLEEFADQGYTRAEASCMADVIRRVVPPAGGRMSDQEELAFVSQLNECAAPVGPAAGSAAPGTDADLDALWTACDEGWADGCLELFVQSPVDSEYETFGSTCGGRVVVPMDCDLYLTGESDPDSAYGTGISLEDVAETGSAPPGEDAELDALWERCSAQDAGACDELFFEAPLNSDYETYGFTCGGRTESGDCSVLFASG